MEKEIKILILAKSIDGGTGTYILSLLNLPEIINKQSSIKILVLEKPRYRKTKKLNKNFYFLNEKGKYPQNYGLTTPNILSFIKEISWTNHQINLIKPNILLGVGVHANLLLMINKKLLRKKILTILSTHIELEKTLLEKSSSSLYFLLKKTVAFFYHQADENVCVSKGVSQSLKKGFGLKINPKVIYNGIKTSSTSKIISLNTKAPVFISVTRLTAQKRIDNLICAFKGVVEKVPKSKLLIVGDGPTKIQLVNLTKKLKLDKNITFSGWVNNVSSYQNKANIFVLSSKREGFPYVLLETMSLAKPIISTEAPHGPSEVLDGGKYGILVPVNDVHALEKAMIKLATNKKLYKKFARLSLERSRGFTEDKMLESYKKVILNLLK